MQIVRDDQGGEVRPVTHVQPLNPEPWAAAWCSCVYTLSLEKELPLLLHVGMAAASQPCMSSMYKPRSRQVRSFTCLAASLAGTSAVLVITAAVAGHCRMAATLHVAVAGCALPPITQHIPAVTEWVVIDTANNQWQLALGWLAVQHHRTSCTCATCCATHASTRSTVSARISSA